LSTLHSLDPSQHRELLRAFLGAFLAEDLGSGDVTTDSIVPAEQLARGELLAKDPLVLAGVDLFVEVFRLLDPVAKAEIHSHDGDELRPGDVPLKLHAHARALLTGERVALNLLQRLSGVATLTQKYVRTIEGTSASIVDTRKTTPGMRTFEKYAVRVGGGVNHRMDLGEAVLIKDNHIRLAGSVDNALAAVQAAKSHVAWIEVEVTDLEQLHAALASRPDTILLDNMSPLQVREAVDKIRRVDSERKIRIEASGGINLSNVRQFAEAGVDWISVGALTHSAPAVDLSFEIEPV
jgi:nicotinate-nucleotide pyrophosphorylase (carboxylating)